MNAYVHQRRLLSDVAATITLEPREADEVADQIGRPGPITVTFCNPLSLSIAQEHPDYLGLLGKFDFVHADGILLAKIAGSIRGRRVPRLSFDGSSVGGACWRRLRDINGTVALVGGVEGIASRCGRVLADRNINVAYTHSGFFRGTGHRSAVIQEIVALNPTAVVSGMGAPHQERFLLDLVGAGYSGFAASCGGYLDQVARAGKTEHYPDWVDKFNLRFAHRIIAEPRRMVHRYLVDYSPFYRAAIPVALSGIIRGSRTEGRRRENELMP